MLWELVAAGAISIGGVALVIRPFGRAAAIIFGVTAGFWGLLLWKGGHPITGIIQAVSGAAAAAVIGLSAPRPGEPVRRRRTPEGDEPATFFRLLAAILGGVVALGLSRTVPLQSDAGFSPTSVAWYGSAISALLVLLLARSLGRAACGLLLLSATGTSFVAILLPGEGLATAAAGGVATLTLALLMARASEDRATQEGKGKSIGLFLLVLAAAAGALIARPSSPAAVIVLELAFFALVPALPQGRQDGSSGGQRYLAVVVLGGTLGQMALAVAGLYPTSHDPSGPRLALALAVVGWGTLVAIFPFQFWLAPLVRVGSAPVVAALMGIVRPLALAVLLGALASFPWLLADPRPLALLTTAGAVAAFASGALSLGQRQLSTRLFYLATTDVAFILAGVASGSALGFAGAVAATISHALAMLLLPASLVLLGTADKALEKGRGRQIGAVGLGIGLLALLGAPPGSGFVGRWMVLQAVWASNPYAVALLLGASALALLSSAALAREALSRVDTADRGNGNARKMRALAAVTAGGIAAVLAIGIYPAPLIDVIVAALAAQSGMPAW